MRHPLKFGSFLLLLFLLCCPIAVFPQTNRGMGVPSESLPDELRGLAPRDYFIPSSLKKVGSIHRLEGNVVVIHSTDRQAYFGAQGDPVYEKDTLVTLDRSKCRIRFVDEDVVTMAPQTEFRVDSLEDERENGRKSSFFRLLKGKVAVYALRLFRYRDIRFALATPTNAIGVRGTKFGVHVYLVEDQGGGPLRPVTDCFCEQGLVDVDGRLVAPGQMFEGRTGRVIPTPPEVIRSFRDATEFGSEDKKDQTPGAGERTPSTPSFNAFPGAEIQDDITSTIQSQTGRSPEQSPQQKSSTPAPSPPQPSPSLDTSPGTAPPTVGR